MAISEKLNSAQKMKVCSLSELDYLITELEPTDEALHAYRDMGIKLM